MMQNLNMEDPSLPSFPKLEPKHKIFLSHSGHQKPFVEQLCKDLEAACHYPFFDQRDDSLPKGKEFGPLIIKAAEQCRVAVIVLSPEFLSSLWPMQELAEFVKASASDNKELIMLPLFYKLSPIDLTKKRISERWMSEWKSLHEKNSKRVNVEEWEKAVQRLRRANGLEFAKFGGSEANYREAVVKAIFSYVRPDLLHDTSEVQGCDRMCEVISEMFVEHTSSMESSSPQPRKLGLYGMGGLGKTTMCKALCNRFQEEFCGRVFHVELGSEVDPLTLQKQVLKRVLRVSDEKLQSITSTSEGVRVLKDRMSYHSVFLAVDNVGDAEDCRTEARAFLDPKFHPDSKIMVVSRSKLVVEALLGDPEYCKPLPDLMIEEAAAIFLSKATAPKKEFSSLANCEERNIVGVCLKECLFSPDGDTNTDLNRRGQYHPLALGALGVYFHDISSSNLLLWKTRLHEVDKLMRSRDCPRIFRILGLQFSTLDETKKLMFLDVALYAHGWIGSFKLYKREDWVKWLAALQNERNRTVIRDKMNDLERIAMINLGESTVATHDLYKEYAKWYVSKDGDANARWCVYEEHAEDLPQALQSNASAGGCWPDLMRISMEGNLKYARISSKKVQEWRNVVVLQLHFCSEITKLDLDGFDCLCHLELVGLTKLKSLIFSADIDDEDDCTPQLKLQFVLLQDLTALQHLPNFSPCSSLRMFILKNCPKLTEPLASLETCSHMETFELNSQHSPCMLNLNLSAMTSLEEIRIMGELHKLKSLEELMGLGNLTNMRSLTLLHFPIKRLPGLGSLSNLHIISLDGCGYLTELPDLSGLAQVEVLNVSWTKVQKIRGVDRMLKLQALDCRGCSELVELPDLDHLSSLRFVNTLSCKLLLKQPKVPKHPCVHDRDKVITTGSKSKDKVITERFKNYEVEEFAGDFFNMIETRFRV